MEYELKDGIRVYWKLIVTDLGINSYNNEFDDHTWNIMLCTNDSAAPTKVSIETKMRGQYDLRPPLTDIIQHLGSNINSVFFDLIIVAQYHKNNFQ